MALDNYHSNSVIKSWQKLLEYEADSRGAEVNFDMTSNWDFLLDDAESFTAGKVRTRHSWEYDPPNEDRVFFQSNVESDAQSRISDGTIFTVILDLYSRSDEFDTDEDHFLVIKPSERKMITGSDEKGTVFVANPSTGGRYYHYSPPNTDNKRWVSANDWDAIFGVS